MRPWFDNKGPTVTIQQFVQRHPILFLLFTCFLLLPVKNWLVRNNTRDRSCIYYCRLLLPSNIWARNSSLRKFTGTASMRDTQRLIAMKQLLPRSTEQCALGNSQVARPYQWQQVNPLLLLLWKQGPQQALQQPQDGSLFVRGAYEINTGTRNSYTQFKATSGQNVEMSSMNQHILPLF